MKKAVFCLSVVTEIPPTATSHFSMKSFIRCFGRIWPFEPQNGTNQPPVWLLKVILTVPGSSASTFSMVVKLPPLTLDDDTPVLICDSPPSNPCAYYQQTLNQPFAGTANLEFRGGAGTGPLNACNGTPMKGNWQLLVWDQSGNGTTSVLNSWGLQITAARPVK